MTALRTTLLNAFQTQLTTEMGPNDLTADVATIGSLATPCYLVLSYDNDALREYVLFDGTFGGSSFVTTSISNRYLSGSAAGSNLTHPIGAKVICAPLSQHIDDLHDVIAALDHGGLSGLGDDDHPQYLLKTGGTLTGDLILNADPDADMKAATKQYVDAATVGEIYFLQNHTGTFNFTGTSRVEAFKETAVIPADWVSFFYEIIWNFRHDPIGYADGTYHPELQKSDGTVVRGFTDVTYDHGHSDPIIVNLNPADPNGSPELFTADFLGDREIDVVLDARETNHGGNGALYLVGFSIKLTRLT